MTRVAPLLAAIALLSSPALAGSYSARPVTAPSAAKIIGKDISWACAGGACSGTSEGSRPLVICQDLAKRAGRIERFAADGRALGTAELDKCNASAKGGATKALAKVN
ncbi:MAG TPA: hypothetical protein VNA29_00115 [Sphingomicrobium sp.]|nr:hypothetical protein [Sphingomicrobium sp.]